MIHKQLAQIAKLSVNQKMKGGENLYSNFEKLCKEKNVTPYRVCKETGVATATISAWKKGKYTPKQDKLRKIAEYFGVSISYFM